MKIGVVVCYLGKLPWYFDYFIHSCSFNSTVDFIIFTDDNTYNRVLPGNISINHITIHDFNKLASKQLSLDINVKAGYKICDFRPAYGVIFKDMLREYDFWGHADIDVIFGDISSFINKDVLHKFEIISVRPEYISGFFALYRNIRQINELFLQTRDYETIFTGDDYFGFDECSLLCMPLIRGSQLNELTAVTESMTHITKELSLKGVLRSYFDLHAIEGIPGKMKWENGRLLYDRKFEALLYHLITFKGHSLLQIPEWKSIPTSYFINEHSFSAAEMQGQ